MQSKLSRFVLVFTTLVLASGMALAGQLQYEVTITNLTKGQPFSPAVVALHTARMTPIFTLGEPSSQGIWKIAESGDVSVLAPQLSADPNVFDVQVSDGPFLPGQSVTVILNGGNRPGLRYLSLAGMLGSTNDGFFALNGQSVSSLWYPYLPNVGTMVYYATAYDAGSEANSETCDTVPGPPCDNEMNERDTANAEGYVYIHSGVHGVAGPPLDGLPAGTSDWRNPVAKITVRASRSGF